MNNHSGAGLQAELEQVRGELAAWRSASGRRQRLPDGVWRKAARAARKYGVNPVSKALGLDYTCLKRRVVGDAGSGSGPAFVEVKPPVSPEGVACVIELEKSSGTRMRICVKSAALVDWCRIKEAFLGA